MITEILMENPNDLMIYNDPYSIIERREIYEIIEKSLDEVPRRDKYILLKYVQCDNYARIGRMFGLREDVVKHIVCNVCRIIRQNLYIYRQQIEPDETIISVFNTRSFYNLE